MTEPALAIADLQGFYGESHVLHGVAARFEDADFQHVADLGLLDRVGARARGALGTGLLLRSTVQNWVVDQRPTTAVAIRENLR